jgi:hypothetical protein
LTIVGHLANFVAHPTESDTDIEARLGNVVQNCCGERAVIAITVVRRCSTRSSKGNKGLRAHIDRAKPGRDLTLCLAALHSAQEWVIPAGIENDEP